MLGNTGDDLANFWGLIATGTAVVGIGWTLAHRIWRWAFVAIGSAFVVSGLFWHPIKQAMPHLAGAVTVITADPQNWFSVAFVAVMAIWMHQYFRQLFDIRNELLGLRDGWPKDSRENTAQVGSSGNIAQSVKQLEKRLADTQTMAADTLAKVDRIALSIQARADAAARETTELNKRLDRIIGWSRGLEHLSHRRLLVEHLRRELRRGFDAMAEAGAEAMRMPGIEFNEMQVFGLFWGVIEPMIKQCHLELGLKNNPIEGIVGNPVPAGPAPGEDEFPEFYRQQYRDAYCAVHRMETAFEGLLKEAEAETRAKLDALF